ncbi:MAG: MOP flippase family protein [Planctomycetota bacterium]|nr:MAG: MOP flippase family protein [Planctomycetota bacterium]
MTLRTEAAAGVRWSSIAIGGKYGVGLLTTIVLVGLLDPADFGLLAMAIVFVELASLFYDLGTSAAIVQRPALSDRLLSSIFWVNAGLGLLCTVILIAVAPLLALLFNEPRLEPFVSLLALTVAISGLSVVHAALARRNLAFSTVARVELAAVLLGAVVGITSAVLGKGAWSLVYQALTVSCVSTLGWWIAVRWRPGLVISWDALRGVAGFSLNLTGFSIVNFAARRADYLLIGGYLGATALGYYTLAYKIVLYTVQCFSSAITRVMFPVYSKIQADHQRLRAAFTKVAVATAAVVFPAMIGLMIVAEPLVALFGEKWAPVAVLLIILAPVGMIQSIVGALVAIYLAKGRTGLFFAWGVGAGLVVITGLMIGIRFGVVWTAVSFAVAQLLLVYPSLVIPFRLIDLPLGQFLSVLRPTLACTAVMGLIVLGIRFLLPPALPPAATLSVLVAAGIGSYLVSSLLLNRKQTREMLHFALARAA